MSNVKWGVATTIAVLGAGLLVGWQQRRTNAQLRGERSGWVDPSREMARLRDENRQLAQEAAEAERYRGDAAELERLKQEAGALAERAGASDAKRQQELAGQAAAAAAETETRIYDGAEVDQLPVPTQGSRPVYPPELRRAGVTGEAVVSFVVAANGVIQGVEGISATHPEFEAAAVEAVKKWKFTAGQKSGIPVGVRLQLPVVFSLNHENK